MIIETFKIVPEFPKYKVSDLGNVISLNYRRSGKEQLMTISLNKKGYPVVKFGKTVQVIHRLVAKTFIPNPENKTQVNHINGIKTDNRVENLEWVTASENTKHAYDNGLIVKRFGNYYRISKLTDEEVSEIRKNINKQTQLQLSKTYDVSEQSINSIINNRRRTNIL